MGHFLTGVFGLQILVPGGLRGLAVGLSSSEGAPRPSDPLTTSPGFAHRPAPFLQPGKPGPSCAFHAEPKWEGLLPRLQGFLQHLPGKRGLSLGSSFSRCPGHAESWPVCRTACDPVCFNGDFGLWPESLPVCFTDSYLEPQIRLIKKPAPRGTINVT